MTDPKEKRKHRREGAAFSVRYRVQEPIHVRMALGDDDLEGLAEDLSVGGLCLSTSHVLPTGAILSIKFRAIQGSGTGDWGSQKFELRGQVCYCRTAEKNSYRSGIRFEAISETDKKFIAARNTLVG